MSVLYAEHPPLRTCLAPHKTWYMRPRGKCAPCLLRHLLNIRALCSAHMLCIHMFSVKYKSIDQINVWIFVVYAQLVLSHTMSHDISLMHNYSSELVRVVSSSMRATKRFLP